MNELDIELDIEAKERRSTGFIYIFVATPGVRTYIPSIFN
jgi:hypothetical protein